MNMLSEEVRWLEQELDEARERGDGAMLQARRPQEQQCQCPVCNGQRASLILVVLL